MKLIGEVNFDVSYSFIFLTPGTPAADMVDDVPEEEKSSVCIFYWNVSTSRPTRGVVVCSGTVQRILVEGTSRKASWNCLVEPKITAW